MYKRHQISSPIYLNTITYIFVSLAFILLTPKVNGQNNLDHHSDSIAIITTSSNQEVRGILIKENKQIITIETANEERTFNKNEVRHIRYITRNEIFNSKEFENPNPNYNRYCFMPSSFINKPAEFSTSSHYFVTANSKIGLHKNVEFSIGDFLLFNLYSSITFSKNITNHFLGRRSLTAAGSVMGNYLIDINNNNSNNINGWGGIGRITLGNEYRNSSLGFIGYNMNLFGGFFYGGYLGSQIKIKERFTIAGESVGLTFDNVQYLFLNSIILNWIRNSSEDWSVGVIYIGTNVQNGVININNNALIVPYVGYQRRF